MRGFNWFLASGDMAADGTERRPLYTGGFVASRLPLVY